MMRFMLADRRWPAERFLETSRHCAVPAFFEIPTRTADRFRSVDVEKEPKGSHARWDPLQQQRPLPSVANNQAILPPAERLVNCDFLLDVGHAMQYYQEGWTEVKAAERKGVPSVVN